MSRRVYIDLGANHGETVEAFLQKNSGFVIHAFEPTPELARELRLKFAEASLNVQVLECAAWIEDGSVTFYRGRQSDQSSTLLQGKRPYPGWDVDYDARITVRSVDFDGWLLRNTDAGDHVVVKMDIEGAEYRLLSHLMSTGSIRRIAKLAVEWHADRFPLEVSSEDHRRIRDRVRAITDLVDWT